jgi:hypothetical protein
LKTDFIPKEGELENEPPWLSDESINMLVTILKYANANNETRVEAVLDARCNGGLVAVVR